MGDPSGKSPGPSPAGGSDMFEASFSAFSSGPATAGSEELAFSTDTSNFADAGAESSSAAFGSFDGTEKRDDAKNRFDAFGGSGAWGNEQAVQLQTSGTVTADGFPAAFSGAGADAEQRAATVARNEEIEALLRQEAEIAAKLEQLRLQEAQLRRSQNNI
jgi:hypothetical protein